MSFPQLLRRSAFAQHDPLITRIYTSTPSAISQTGDWGLKYPIHRPKGPKYIKVSNLDAGAAVGADWRSGEKEARFTEAWGTGKVRWQRMGQAPTIRKAKLNYDSLMEDEPLPDEPDLLLPDLESMTPSEFERYLDTIREKRKEFLPVRLNEINTSGWRAEEGDHTLVNIATAGHSTQIDGTKLQSGIVKVEMVHPSSKTIQSHPHPQGGLYYSQPLHTSPTYMDPRTTIPGRALNKKDRAAHRQDGLSSRLAPSDNNIPFVVSVGGITASSRPRGSANDETSLSETDYTRTSPERGVGRFQIQSAKFNTLPTVINLQSSEIASRYGAFARSLAKRATPLDTFTFNVDLDLAPESTGKQAEPGSREWVGQDRSRASLLSREDGLGSSRAYRVKGAALASLRVQEREARETQKRSMVGLRDLIRRRTSPLRQQ